MLAANPFLILPGICVPAPLGSGMCPADTKLPNYFDPAGFIDINLLLGRETQHVAG